MKRHAKPDQSLVKAFETLMKEDVPMPRKATKSDMKNKPYVANYPPLKEWLDKHDARCMWQLRLGGTEDDPTGFVECWMFPAGRLAIITVHANRNGWSVFTEANTNKIDETLQDAGVRLGLPDALESRHLDELSERDDRYGED